MKSDRGPGRGTIARSRRSLDAWSTSGAEAGALAYVEQRVALSSIEAHCRIARSLARHRHPEHLRRTLVDALAENARVTLSFHPDRFRADGATVAEGLLRDGRYRSQFHTGVTNGSPTAFPGGERDLWEARLFGGGTERASLLNVP